MYTLFVMNRHKYFFFFFARIVIISNLKIGGVLWDWDPAETLKIVQVEVLIFKND